MSHIFAIAWVRVRLLLNRMRSRSSKLEVLLSLVAILLGVLASLGIATLVGALLQSTATSDNPDTLLKGMAATFAVVCSMGIMIPIMLSSGASGLDTTQLTIFPVKRQRLFLISWASAFLSADHLVHYPILIAAYFVLHSHGLHGGWGGALLFLCIPLIVVSWSFAILSFVQGVLKHRRSKEIAGMLGFALFLAICLLPTALNEGTRSAEFLNPSEFTGTAGEAAPNEREAPAMQFAMDAVQWTPPWIAAQAMVDFQEGNKQPGLAGLLLLGLWFLAGLLAANLVFLWRLRNNLGATRSGSASAGRTWLQFDATRLFPFLPVEVVGVTSRELRYVFRSSVGKLNVLLVPMVCSILLIALSRGLPALAEGAPARGVGSELSVLMGLSVYGLLFTNNFVNNSVGWEGVGFKSYLLSPVPLQRVLLGKNLGHWIYALLLYCLIVATWSVLRGIPSPEAIFQTLAFFCGSIVVFTASGNFASILFPIPRDISAMKSQPSHPAVLCSLGTVLCVSGVLLFLLALSVHLPWLSMSISLCLYVLGALGFYWASLPFAARLFYAKSDRVLAKLEAGI